MCAWLLTSDTIFVFINNRSLRLAQMYPLINSDYLKPNNKTTDLYARRRAFNLGVCDRSLVFEKSRFLHF